MTNYEWLIEHWSVAYFLRAIHNNDFQTLEDMCVMHFELQKEDIFSICLGLANWLETEHIEKEFAVSYKDVRNIIQDTIYREDECCQVTDKLKSELVTQIFKKLAKLDKTPVEIKDKDEENKDDKL